MHQLHPFHQSPAPLPSFSGSLNQTRTRTGHLLYQKRTIHISEEEMRFLALVVSASHSPTPAQRPVAAIPAVLLAKRESEQRVYLSWGTRRIRRTRRESSKCSRPPSLAHGTSRSVSIHSRKLPS